MKFLNDFAKLRCEFFRLELAFSANYALPGNYSRAKPPEEPTIVELDFIIREFVDINDRRNVSSTKRLFSFLKLFLSFQNLMTQNITKRSNVPFLRRHYTQETIKM